MFPPCSAQFRLILSHGHQPISVSSNPTKRRVWMQRFCGAIDHGSFHESNRRDRWVLSLVRSAVHQREDPCLFPRVIERMKPPDFIETTNGVQSVEKTCVAGRKLARLEVTATQVRIAKCLGTLPREKVKTQPAAVGRRDALGFSEKGDK